MTQYITVAADDRVEARNGVIKLHGPEGFEGMRRAGRLAAEILDALAPHVVPGVSTDELVAYKLKKVVIPFTERMEIIRSIRYVDAVVPQETMDKFESWKRLQFDIMFVGDDWYQTDKWQDFEKQFTEVGVRIVYFPYTKGTSSTVLNEALVKLRSES